MENVGMHGLRNLIILRKSDYWNLQRYNFFPFFTWEDGQHFRFHLDPDMIKEVGGLRASIKCRILSSKDSVHFNHSSVTSINELNRFNVIEKMETIVDPSQAIQKRSGDNGGDLDIEPKKVKSSID